MRLIYLLSLLLFFALAVDKSFASACRIEMVDEINTIDSLPSVSLLEIREVKTKSKNRNFIITDKVDSDNSWIEKFYISKKDGLLNGPSGLGKALTKNEILKRYKMKDDKQLRFTVLPGYDCSSLDKAIVYYFIMEWFYFG